MPSTMPRDMTNAQVAMFLRRGHVSTVQGIFFGFLVLTWTLAAAASNSPVQYPWWAQSMGSVTASLVAVCASVAEKGVARQEEITDAKKRSDKIKNQTLEQMNASCKGGLGSKHQRGHYELVSCHHLPEDGRRTGGRSRNLLPACKDIRRAQMEPSSLHYASRRCFGASSGA